MAHTKQDQRADYPLMAYNFRVSIDGQSMSFAEVSGLHREHKTLTYRHGLSFWEGEEITKYRHDTYVSISMKRGTTRSRTFLYEWLEKRAPSTMDVSLCDETGAPVVRWHIARAIAVKLSAPSFDAQSSAVSIESLEVKASGISVSNL